MTTERETEALAEVGNLAAVIATPTASGNVYIAHAQIREALAEHILASDWLADHVARIVAEAAQAALREAADEFADGCQRDKPRLREAVPAWLRERAAQIGGDE